MLAPWVTFVTDSGIIDHIVNHIARHSRWEGGAEGHPWGHWTKSPGQNPKQRSSFSTPGLAPEAVCERNLLVTLLENEPLVLSLFGKFKETVKLVFLFGIIEVGWIFSAEFSHKLARYLAG
jgi:hypothetical protein